MDDTSETTDVDPRFRGLLEAAPDAMVGVARNGEILWINSQCERLFGYERSELLGQPVELLVPVSARAGHPEHRRRYFDQPTTRPMGAGINLEGRRRDGSTFPAEISLSALGDGDDLIVTAAIRDVTERRRAERDLRLAREEAERANRAKSEFLSRMSHELRTPLNAVLGYAQLLEMEDLDPEHGEYVGSIHDAGRHLLGLIDEVLDISRIESGHLHLRLEPVPVGRVVRESVDLAQRMAHDARVLLRVDPDSPEAAMVFADHQRLKQVVLNLVSNAVKYNRPGGEATISWREEGDRVQLTVRDTGVGIPAEYIPRLFQPFERLAAINGTVEGTGLGLALSKGLVDGMGGTIDVESSPQEGSVFTVVLDRAAPQEEEGTAGPGEGVRRGRRRVLYVEDNLSNLQLVEHILGRRPDCELVPTMQGSLALELARQYRPAVVLLDLHLPDLPGDVVIEQLLADERTRDIPVIVLTADATEARRSELLTRGAYGYLTKPIDVASFLELLDLALARSIGREHRH